MMWSNETLYLDDSEPSEVISVVIIQFMAAVKFISEYYTIVLIIVGFICNPLAFIVFSRRAYRGSTVSIYLRYLALVDFGAIVIGVTDHYLIAAMNFDIFSVSPLVCQWHTFALTFCLNSSSWTLVLVTGERVVSVIWPHRVKTWTTPKAAKCGVGIVFAIALCSSVPIPIIFGQIDDWDPELQENFTWYCEVVVNYEVSSEIWYTFDGIMFAFLPCSLLLPFNAVIIFGVIQSKNRLKKVTKVQKSNSEAGSKKSGKGSGESSRDRSLMITLIVINSTFITCNFPICAWQFGPHYLGEGIYPHGDSISSLLLVLMLTNNALNFLLYCITGTKFRQEVKAFFVEFFQELGKCCKK